MDNLSDGDVVSLPVDTVTFAAGLSPSGTGRMVFSVVAKQHWRKKQLCSSGAWAAQQAMVCPASLQKCSVANEATLGMVFFDGLVVVDLLTLTN